MERVILSWSGGKDSAMALYELRRRGDYEVVALLTTVAREFERVSHHGVRVELLEKQAAAVGVPLHKLYLPPDRCTNADYEALMEQTLQGFGRPSVALQNQMFVARCRSVALLSRLLHHP